MENKELHRIADAIKNDTGINNPNRWTEIDGLVKEYAERGAGRHIENPYEYTAFDENLKDDLNSNDLKKVLAALKQIEQDFREEI